MELPAFRYHPNPIATGSVQHSSTACVCCGQARGFIYVGPVYSEEEYSDCICPWCIASGEAHDRLGAEFTDAEGIGDRGTWDDVSQAVRVEISTRTPGFNGWQQERWWTHCGDAGVFIGPAGASMVKGHGEPTIQVLREDLGWADGPDFREYIDDLAADGQPTAYLFRCRHCGLVGGYSDFT